MQLAYDCDRSGKAYTAVYYTLAALVGQSLRSPGVQPDPTQSPKALEHLELKLLDSLVT